MMLITTTDKSSDLSSFSSVEHGIIYTLKQGHTVLVSEYMMTLHSSIESLVPMFIHTQIEVKYWIKHQGL